MSRFVIKQLIKSLRALAPLHGQRGHIEALKSVKLMFGAAGITMTASDLETTVEIDVPAAWVAEPRPFVAIINAKQLLAALGSMQGKIAMAEQLQRELPGLRLIDEAGAVVELNGVVSVEDFPHAPSVNLQPFVTLPAQELARLVRVAGVAMAAENNRFSIAGMQLEFTPTGVRAVATDGHQLAVVEAAATVAATRELIIAAPAVEVLETLEPSGEVAIAADASWVEVQGEGYRLIAKVSEKLFPPYQDLLAHHYATHTSVDRAALVAALKRAVAVDRKRPRSVWQIDPEKGNLTISASAESGAVSMAVPAAIEGVQLRIGIQPRQVLEFLASVIDEKIQFDCDGSDNQARVRSEAGALLVMPVSLN